MTLSETFDRFDLIDITPDDIPLGEGDHFDAAAIVIGDGAADDALDDERAEPALASLPFLIEFDEPERLDPERIGLAWELLEQRAPWMRLRSPLIALAAHLLPIIAIILLPLIMIEPPPAIPVQLVFEPPPPEPEPPPVEQPPVHAEAQSQPVQPAPAPPTPPLHAEAQTPPVPPPPPKPVPPPKPLPPPKPVALPKPAPPTPPVHAEAQPQPAPLPLPQPAPVANPAKPPPAPAPAAAPPRPQAPIAQFPSAGTSRDGYLTYLVTLTHQHIDLLPRSLVGNRRGETVVRVAVRRDGVIDHIEIAQPSGYPDIDERVERMVAAVGRFPPVPEAFQGSPVELDLNFLFPEALQAQ